MRNPRGPQALEGFNYWTQKEGEDSRMSRSSKGRMGAFGKTHANTELLQWTNKELYTWFQPDIMDDMVYAHSNLSAAVTSFTFGYFVYDFFDLLAASRWSISKNNFDIILHHVLVICCFGSCVGKLSFWILFLCRFLQILQFFFSPAALHGSFNAFNPDGSQLCFPPPQKNLP